MAPRSSNLSSRIIGTKMTRLHLPGSIDENRYYPIHVRYIASAATAAGIIVTPSLNNTTVGKHRFTALVNSTKIVFDYSNFLDYHRDPTLPSFKFQYSEGPHERTPYLFPFTKVSFYDWAEFAKLQTTIKYRATGDRIISRQRPYGGAIQRRKLVQGLLLKHYKSVATSIVEQHVFWQEINNCLVAVFVPGARNDILDRGHIQYMAFGCCTIAPKILDILPYNQRIIPDVHYVMCKPDYSDLIAKIEWCQSHRKDCLAIGAAARKLFLETSTPQKLWGWVDQCLQK
jgi:hypothetical protein